MKRYLYCVLAMGLSLLLSTAIAQKSYYLKDVLQEVFIAADGTVRVEDTRSIVLNGDFSKNTYFVDIDPAAGGQVRFEDFVVLDGGTPTQPEFNGNEIAWKVRGANETRRFKFTYTLTNELQVATDIARFNRQVLEPQHAKIDGYTQIIHPPGPSPEHFKVFIFNESGRIGTLDFVPDFSRALVELSKVDENESLRSDVLFEADLFTFQTINSPMEAKWLAENGVLVTLAASDALQVYKTAAERSNRYEVSEVEGSGVSGSVFVADYGFDNAIVAILIKETPMHGMHPAHFHAGNCGSSGDIVVPLNDVHGDSGWSITTMTAPFDAITTGDHYLNIHLLSEDQGTIVACGEVGKNAD